MRTYDGYEMASTKSIADLAAAFVNAVLEHPSLPLEQALSSISARLPESMDTQIVAFRQQQWLLMHWLAGVYEWAPDGTAQEAVSWVRDHTGAQAASACLAHSGVLGHPGASLERVLQDWNQLDRIAAWVRLLAAVIATRGDGTAQWLRQFDPPEPADQGTVAWLVGCEPPRSWPPELCRPAGGDGRGTRSQGHTPRLRTRHLRRLGFRSEGRTMSAGNAWPVAVRLPRGRYDHKARFVDGVLDVACNGITRFPKTAIANGRSGW